MKDGSEYYGPYAKVRQAKALIDVIKNLYKLRTCNLNLSQGKKVHREDRCHSWDYQRRFQKGKAIFGGGNVSLRREIRV